MMNCDSHTRPAVVINKIDSIRAAQLSGIPLAGIRCLARAELIGIKERGRFIYSFHDLSILRTIKKLQKKGLTLAHISRSLTAVKKVGKWSIGDLSYSDGRVRAKFNGLYWDAESGQGLVPLTERHSYHTRHLHHSPKSNTDKIVSFTSAANLSKDHNINTEDAYIENGEFNLQRQDNSLLDPIAEMFELGVNCEEQEEFEDAHDAYLSVLAYDPEHVDALNNIAGICLLWKDLKRSLAFLRQALRVDSSNPIAWMNFGLTHQESGDEGQAVKGYQRAIELDNQFAAPHFYLAALYTERGDPIAATSHREKYHYLTHPDAVSEIRASSA